MSEHENRAFERNSRYMGPVKFFAIITASLIAVSAAALSASADESEAVCESSIALQEPAEDNTDSIGEETSENTIRPDVVTAAVAAADKGTASDDSENASAGAQAGIALALAAIACSIVVVSRRQ